MAMQNHGGPEKQSRLMQMFQEQMNGTARREYPAGRMGAEDDGAIAYALASDDRHGKIVMRFPKAVEWVALDLQHATELRDQLTERILAMRGVTA